MKIWCTKWALTKGVEEFENAEVCENVSTDMVSVKTQSGYPLHLHGEGKDWHRDELSANRRLAVMLEKKIKSLRTSMKKMEGLRNIVNLKIEMLEKRQNAKQKI